MRTTPNTRFNLSRRPAARRGIVMILVVVILVLLAIVGAAYLQIVRVDRLANIQPTDNLDLVVSSVISEIQRELTEDLTYVDPTNPDATAYPNNAMFSELRKDDNMDYPSHSASGYYRDNFLAPQEPAGATWANVTHISSAVKDAESVYRDALKNVGVSQPMEDSAILFTNVTAAAPNATDNPTTADADGDGLLDSRWMRPALDKVNGVNYVYAARIVDNSAMINVGVALDTRLGSTVIQAPRCWFPCDLDCAVAVPSLGSGGTPGEMSTLLQYRFAGASVSPTTREIRSEFWYVGPNVAAGSAYARSVISADNEMELRYRFGLNSTTQSELETGTKGGMTTLLRHNLGAETAYPAGIAGDRRHHLTVHSGISTVAPDASGPTAKPRFPLWTLWGAGSDPARTEFVKLMRSTDMPFDQAYTPAANRPESVPFSSDTTNLTAAAQYLACLIDYFDEGNPDYTSPYGTGLTETTSAKADSRIAKIGIAADGTVSSTGAGVVTRYGMEALPFLTEASIQAAYWLTAATDAAPGDDTDNHYNMTWTRSDKAPTAGSNGIGYAIEMVNPFRSPVRNLAHVRMVVNGTAWGTLDTLCGSTTLQGWKSGGGNKYGIILYRNSDGTANSNNGDVKQAIQSWNSDVDSFAANAYVAASSHAIMMDDSTPSSELVIELQVLVDPGDGSAGGSEWITYSRIQRRTGDGSTADDSTDRLWLPTTIDKTNVDLGTGADDQGAVLTANNGKDYERFIQRTAACDWGEGTGGGMMPTLNPIAVICINGNNEMAAWGTDAGDTTTWTTEWPAPDLTTANPKAPNNTYGQIGKADKAVPGGLSSQIAADYVEPFKSDNAGKRANYAYAFDDVALRYVTDLYRPMWIGPTAGKTYAEVFRDSEATLALLVTDPGGNLDQIRSRMLSFKDPVAEALDITTRPLGLRALPRGQLLLDRVIAMRASSAQPIYGMLNLNTAPQAVLTQAIPITPNATLVTEIVAMRAGTLSGKLRATLPGICSIGELLQLPSATVWGADGIPNTTSGGVQVAFDGGGFELPATGSTTSATPNSSTPPVDDRTEEVRLVGMLANMCTTRSDYFTAYIVAQGFRNDWTSPVETGQFIVTFDRSSVTAASGTPRIVGILRVK